jgi:hypothetical protein
MRHARNKEGYPDPTASEALANIRREEKENARKNHKKKHRKIRKDAAGDKKTRNG